ncbi:hypothetical protein DMX03_23885 [Pseudomonas koreensis]|nr:hypothetical protein DMX03_23885 [Pseudomonas koreensis]
MARGFIPVGSRSGPMLCTASSDLGLLRSPTGINPLATGHLPISSFCQTKIPRIRPAAPLNRISNAGNTPRVTMR